MHVQITLKPQMAGGVVDTLKTTVVMEQAAYQAGDVFDSLPLTLAVSKSANYTAEDFDCEDEAGKFGMVCESTMGMFGPQTSYKFDRDVSGKVIISYVAKALTKEPMKGDPGFSLFKNERGCTAAGLIFMLLPAGEHDYVLDYDLSEMDEQSSGVCGFGEGRLENSGALQALKETFYCIGPMHHYNKEGSKLHIVWLADEIKHKDDFCETTATYFDYMEKLFLDEDMPYYIILYPTPRTNLTGTALTRCCYMGFGMDMVESVREIEGVLAHELVHNWLHVYGEEYLGSIFAEGTAEYYSLHLAHQLGRLTDEEYVKAINDKLTFFYSNPYSQLAFEEAYGRSWTHSYAQRIAYGRGILLMLHLDTLIRQCSQGVKSLDDIIITMIAEGKTLPQGMVSWDRFMEICSEATDGAAKNVFALILGKGIVMPPEYFGEWAKVTEGAVLVEANGFDDTVRFEYPRVVHGLVPGSNAERAGLQNGDILLNSPSEWDTAKTETTEAVYRVQRGEEELTISYVPRGEAVPCWNYRKA